MPKTMPTTGGVASGPRHADLLMTTGATAVHELVSRGARTGPAVAILRMSILIQPVAGEPVSRLTIVASVSPDGDRAG